MYHFKEKQITEYGIFQGGNVYSLSKVPDAVKQNWLELGLCTKAELSELEDLDTVQEEPVAKGKKVRDKK